MKPAFFFSQMANDKDVVKIIEMGFTTDQAMTALKQSEGNIQGAINSLLSNGTDTGPPGRDMGRGRGVGRGGGIDGRPNLGDKSERGERGRTSETLFPFRVLTHFASEKFLSKLHN